ncbi:hypothetical protein P3X46_015337 [Hevea brasiliensis]|uniref:K Homology domain-containing protein n=1 Tax=Hevea brasiliensis TaxID=3981 RepID=A0ABQ9LXT5_HEVBR|nr:flowering locus K homology domain-like [Hevea brasiliensis]KAJ9172047.1 hypothetical protein P3X46_015337 [Hevea brasiliensis]
MAGEDLLKRNDGGAPEDLQLKHDDVDVLEDSESPKIQESDPELAHDEGKRWPGWPGENVFRMLIPVQKVGSIIGRKGESIKKIIKETKARIKILDGPPGILERAVMVSAKEEPNVSISPAMDGLLRVHKQILGSDDSASPATSDIKARLLVAGAQAASLIGKQGSTIKSIQDASGCTIRILGAERLPPFALKDDNIVEILGEPASVHKGVELIANHLRKFLVDHSIIGVFETQMQMPNVRSNQNMIPQQSWGPLQAFLNNAGGRNVYGPNSQYLLPQHQHDHYHPHSDIPPFDQQPHLGPSIYGRDTSIGHSSNAQPQSVVGKMIHHMQIPLSYADALIGVSGANISYIRRASGAAIAVQETRDVPGEMTVEINGTASQMQTAQQLIQNVIAEGKSNSQNRTRESIGQGFNAYPAFSSSGSVSREYTPYPAKGLIYASQPSEVTRHVGHSPAENHGSGHGTDYGY